MNVKPWSSTVSWNITRTGLFCHSSGPHSSDWGYGYCSGSSLCFFPDRC